MSAIVVVVDWWLNELEGFLSAIGILSVIISSSYSSLVIVKKVLRASRPTGMSLHSRVICLVWSFRKMILSEVVAVLLLVHRCGCIVVDRVAGLLYTDLQHGQAALSSLDRVVQVPVDTQLMFSSSIAVMLAWVWGVDEILMNKVQTLSDTATYTRLLDCRNTLMFIVLAAHWKVSILELLSSIELIHVLSRWELILISISLSVKLMQVIVILVSINRIIISFVVSLRPSVATTSFELRLILIVLERWF